MLWLAEGLEEGSEDGSEDGIEDGMDDSVEDSVDRLGVEVWSKSAGQSLNGFTVGSSLSDDSGLGLFDWLGTGIRKYSLFDAPGS